MAGSSAANLAPLVPTEVGRMGVQVVEVPTVPWVTRATGSSGNPHLWLLFPGVGKAWDTSPQKVHSGKRNRVLIPLP